MRGWIFLYDVVSVVFGVLAEAFVFVLYLKTRSPKLTGYLVANLLATLIAVVLSMDLYFSILQVDPPVRSVLWYCINILCCGLGYFIPRAGTPRASSLISRRIESAFGIAAALLGLLLILHFTIVQIPSLGLLPSSAYFMALYTATYSLLFLAILFFCVSNLRSARIKKGRGSILTHYRRALFALSIVALAMLPAFALLDFFGWVLPLGFRPPRDLSLLPAFLIVMSLALVIAAVLEILEPDALHPPQIDAAFLEKRGFTKREAEVLPLLLQCLSYKEMGERLFISPGTVRSHVVHIYQKAGVKTRLELERLLRGLGQGPAEGSRLPPA
jgi:DNA-binding CsgD family transcriptional regulator